MALVAAAAFAQGKVSLINDAGSLVMLDPTKPVAAQDVSLRGQAIGNSTPLPSGVTLTAGLYGGTTSTALFLYSTTALNSPAAGSAGVIGPAHFVLNANATPGAPGIPGVANGTPITTSTPWFQVRVWDITAPTYDAALAAGLYTGEGAMFQMNPGSSIAYVNTSPSANSTWTDAPIFVSLVPEPGTFALMGLGTAAMLIFRRRK
jgi:hypothetical protein